MSIWENAKAKAADVADLVAGTVGVNRAIRRSAREGKKLDKEIYAEAERRGWTPFQVLQEVERDYAAKPFDQPKERQVLQMPGTVPSEQGARYWGRQETAATAPAPPRPWAEQIPQVADPDKARYLAEIAQAMDERQARLGEHTAEHQPAWALGALGPVPDRPLDRLDWQDRAAKIAAYREMYGWDHDTEAVGPEPAGDSPEKRAAWHAAFGAINTDAAAARADAEAPARASQRGTDPTPGREAEAG